MTLCLTYLLNNENNNSVSSDNFQRNDKTITKFLFSAVIVTGFSVSLLLRKYLMQLSISLIENAFLFNISSK